MPRTAEGAQLTEAHRQGQMAIRAQALQAYLALWPLWRDDEPESFTDLARAAVSLVWAHYRLSAGLASVYFRLFRAAEGVGGEPTVEMAPQLPEEQIVGTLTHVGPRMHAKARRAGQGPEQARQSALVRTSGSVTRLTLEGGRETLRQSVLADPAAVGWARVTDGDPCPFCRLLASRGPVYKENTASFEAHDHCACSAEPYYPGSEWPGLGKQFRAEYTEAVKRAKARGEYDAGTDNDALNAYRRYLEEERQQPSI